MAVSATNSASVSSSTTSDWVKLAPGPNKVLISAAAWNGTTSASLSYSDDASTSYSIRDTLTTSTMAPAVANLVQDVNGPGYVCITVASYGSNPVTVKVNPCIG